MEALAKRFCSRSICPLYILARRTVQVDWKSVDGAFAKPRRLHLAKGSGGLNHCPVRGCEHPGFASQGGCRKHVKTKHGWYNYFDAKPIVCTSPSAINDTNDNKGPKIVPCCSTDNKFAITRALKFIKFGYDENGDKEEKVLSTPNLIDYVLGCPQLDKIRGHSERQMGYWTIETNLL